MGPHGGEVSLECGADIVEKELVSRGCIPRLACSEWQSS